MLRQWVPVGVFSKVALLVFLPYEMLRQWVPVGVFTRKGAASVPSL